MVGILFLEGFFCEGGDAGQHDIQWGLGLGYVAGSVQVTHL